MVSDAYPTELGMRGGDVDTLRVPQVDEIDFREANRIFETMYVRL